MGIFSSIKDAIFGHNAKAATPPPTAKLPEGGTVEAPPPAAQPTATAPTPVSEVDVEANLAEMGHGKNLNWRTSIVDLMKLLGIDSSLDNRKELARELGYTGDLDGSAEMNLWLHKATMKELAKNGGKVSAELTD